MKTPMGAEEAIDALIAYGRALQAQSTMHQIGAQSSAAGHQAIVDRAIMALAASEPEAREAEVAIREAFEEAAP